MSDKDYAALEQRLERLETQLCQQRLLMDELLRLARVTELSASFSVDAINGVVCRYGQRHGVPTPINDRIVEIIKKGQAGELALTKENIKLFDDLL